MLVLTETKLDDSFPIGQFTIPGFKLPYRKDRNARGGGVLVYVRENIPSKPLHTFQVRDTQHGLFESIFVEIRIKNIKWLFIGSYHPQSQYIIITLSLE